MNKAPVLSDEETKEVFHEEWRIDFREQLPTSAVRNAIAQAQRDKDDAYYRPLIEQARDGGIQAVIDALKDPSHQLNKEVNELITEFFQQAKQETAREILEDIEREFLLITIVSPSLLEPIIMVLRNAKSKYLKEYCVDCNGEVAVKLEDCPKLKEVK